MSASASDNFETLVRFLGWGDPADGLWFIGLEESGAWESAEEIAELMKREHLHFTGAGFYECSPKPQEKRAPGNFGRTQIPQWEAKIAAPLSTSQTDWREYLCSRLWFAGSRVFHSNLYPLGKSNLGTWPAKYEKLFGFAKNQRDAYYRDVRERRFPLIRQFRHDSAPAATICFGRTGWEDFRALLALDPKSAEMNMEGRIEIYSNDHVMLVPFFGNAQVRDSDVDRIISRLKAWRINLP
jgi:hypothetical protein